MPVSSGTGLRRHCDPAGVVPAESVTAATVATVVPLVDTMV